MRESRRMPVGGLAVAGAVAAHALTYAFVGRSQASELLARTGHAYWGTAVAFSVCAGIVGAAALVARNTFRRGGYEEILPSRFALELAAAQTILFLVVETVERIAHGVPVSTLVSDGVLFSGIIFQALVAVALTAALRFLTRSAQRILELSLPVRFPPGKPGIVHVIAPASVIPAPAFISTALVRGPPAH